MADLDTVSILKVPQIQNKVASKQAEVYSSVGSKATSAMVIINTAEETILQASRSEENPFIKTRISKVPFPVFSIYADFLISLEKIKNYSFLSTKIVSYSSVNFYNGVFKTNPVFFQGTTI